MIRRRWAATLALITATGQQVLISWCLDGLRRADATVQPRPADPPLQSGKACRGQAARALGCFPLALSRNCKFRRRCGRGTPWLAWLQYQTWLAARDRAIRWSCWLLSLSKAPVRTQLSSGVACCSVRRCGQGSREPFPFSKVGHLRRNLQYNAFNTTTVVELHSS